MIEKIISEINILKKELNAIILAHYYQRNEIQEIADCLGDSLALAQQAAKTNADVIVFAGVHFMAETAKILNPNKIVILPDMEAGCSLADSCPANDFKEFLKNYPEHIVVSYINCSTQVKAMSDIICTSSNAVQIIEDIPADKRIVFGPDKNLGNYIKNKTGREMVIWNGACHVHEIFSAEKTIELKMKNPDAKLLVHPECKGPLVVAADFVGSTTALLNYTKNSTAKKFIVATENGIIHQMKKFSPNKEFIEAVGNDSCNCSECEYMKLITLEKILACLKNLQPQINIEEDIRLKAEKPIRKMLEISEKLGL
ncbi:MAG: quinolinate synthase NadA [Bacteroidota bacterium]